MTYLQMINEVLRIARLKTVTSLDQTSDATAVAERLNITQQEIATEADWWFNFASGTITTVDGTEQYVVANDVSKIVAAKQVETPTYIQAITRDMLETLYPKRSDGNHKGKPRFITLGSTTTTGSPAQSLQNVVLYPVPDAVMTITYLYSKVMTDMSVATNKSLIPDRWHYTVVYGAAEKTLSVLDDNRSNSFLQKYIGNRLDMRRKERVFNDEDLRWFLPPRIATQIQDPLNQLTDIFAWR